MSMKWVSILSAVVLFSGCASPVQLKNNDLVTNYQTTLSKSKACVTDADCVAIAKGCCLCDGQDAINKKYVDKLNKQRDAACGVGPCTLQMCYTDIDVACVNKICTGTLKQLSSYRAR